MIELSGSGRGKGGLLDISSPPFPFFVLFDVRVCIDDTSNVCILCMMKCFWRGVHQCLRLHIGLQVYYYMRGRKSPSMPKREKG